MGTNRRMASWSTLRRLVAGGNWSAGSLTRLTTVPVQFRVGFFFCLVSFSLVSFGGAAVHQLLLSGGSLYPAVCFNQTPTLDWLRLHRCSGSTNWLRLLLSFARSSHPPLSPSLRSPDTGRKRVARFFVFLSFWFWFVRCLFWRMPRRMAGDCRIREESRLESRRGRPLSDLSVTPERSQAARNYLRGDGASRSISQHLAEVPSINWAIKRFVWLN